MALGSSVINKSSKKLAPKAPAQRRRPQQPEATSKPPPDVSAKVVPVADPDVAGQDLANRTAETTQNPARRLQSPALATEPVGDDIQNDRPLKRRKVAEDEHLAMPSEEANADTSDATTATVQSRQKGSRAETAEEAQSATPLNSSDRAPPAEDLAKTATHDQAADKPAATHAHENHDTGAPTTTPAPLSPPPTQHALPTQAPPTPPPTQPEHSTQAPISPPPTQPDLQPQAPLSPPPTQPNETQSLRFPADKPTAPVDARATTDGPSMADAGNLLALSTARVHPSTDTQPPPNVQSVLEHDDTPAEAAKGPAKRAAQPKKAKAPSKKATKAATKAASQARSALESDAASTPPPEGSTRGRVSAAHRRARKDSTAMDDADEEEALPALPVVSANGNDDSQSTPAAAAAAAGEIAIADEPETTQTADEVGDTNEPGPSSLQAANEAASPRGPPKKARKPKKPRLSAATVDPADMEPSTEAADEAAGPSTSTTPAKKVAKPRKRKETAAKRKSATRETTEAGPEDPIPPNTTESAENGDAPTNEDEEDATTTKTRRKRQRSETPSDAEDAEIDPTATSMLDLTRDMRQGKVSNREREMRKIDWTEVATKRREAEKEAIARAIAGEGPDAEAEDERRREADDEARRRDNATSQRGPQLRLVNGQMILDTESLVMNGRRTAEDNSGEAAVEENDLTKRITQQSWMYANRRAPEERFASNFKSDPWSEEQTDAFYAALRMFGTDFFIISKMFPGKTRRHIKLKFVREEHNDPERVKAALIGEAVPMDMGVYCEATGLDEDHFKDPEALTAELAAQSEAQQEEIEQAKVDATKRQEEKQAAAKEKEKSAKPRKSKKKKAMDEGVEEDLGPG